MKKGWLNPFGSGRLLVRTIASAVIASFVFSVPVFAQDATEEGTPEMNTLPNIVLVHGAWADGSSWTPVIQRLQAQGYNVVAPQFPETSVAADVARLRQVLNRLSGPTIVAAHSYGGIIMSSLGEDTGNVVGLVYIAGFGLDEGESVNGLLSQGELSPAIQHLIIDAQGYAWLPEDDFVNHFMADIDPAVARAAWSVQQPWNTTILSEVMGVPAWKSLPTWFMVATNDEAIPPDAERFFAQRMGATTVEVASGHVAMLSHPEEVTNLILQAVQSTSAAS